MDISDEAEVCPAWLPGDVTIEQLCARADAVASECGCECGSGKPASYSELTKGFDCPECRRSVRVHETCGTAFYALDGAVCDECGKE